MSADDLRLDHARAVTNLGDQCPDCIDPLIFRSWKRCLQDADLDPLRRRDPVVLTDAELRERREPVERLIRLACPEVANLYQAFARSGYAVILTDAHGIILQHLVDESLTSEFRASGLWLGADWGEDRVGTNGIGTCLAEGVPITVHRGDHLLGQNIHLTCSASPIMDPAGRIIAAVDASSCGTSDSRTSQAHARALVATSAKIIENQFFLSRFREQRVLRFHRRPEYIGLPNEALISVGGDGRVLAANQAAVDLLAAETRSELADRPLEELIDGQAGEMPTWDDRSGSVRSFRDQRHGMRFFGFLHRCPEPGGGSAGHITVAPSHQDPETCRSRLCDLDVLAGEDPQMQRSVRRARRVMDKRIPIILNGETGTGKELLSRAIHLASARRDRPFVALNCAAIPESLIESELFGYRHGAFTGARKEGRRGKILEANGGTLFLDEIGDMPLSMQSRLLRVLETREVVPLGSDQAMEVDLDIIAASHRDLLQLVDDGLFREDLYYRLNGITLYLTPLRRRGDLRALALELLAEENDTGRELAVASDAMSALLSHEWPGNIRQLRSVIRTAVALCEDGIIQRDDLNLPPTRDRRRCPGPLPGGQGLTGADDQPRAGDGAAQRLRSAEREAVRDALAAHGWNVSRTADALSMSRNTLYRKMRKHGLIRGAMP